MRGRCTKLTARTVVLILTLVYQELNWDFSIWYDTMPCSVNAGGSGNAWYNNINTLSFPYLTSMIQTMTVSTWCQGFISTIL